MLLSRLYKPLTGALLVLPFGCAVEGTDNVDSIQQAVEADCEATVYEAEEMFHSTGGVTAGGWNIWSNGYISTTHNFEGGTTTLNFVVRGQSAGGAAPNMRVTVGGNQVYNTQVGSSSWTQYNVTFEAAAGEQEVRIYFTNDYYQNGQDRNLYVDSFTVGCGVGLCGNGAVNPAEECDDGSQTSSDSCKMDCTWNVCGDGVLYNLITDPNSPNTAEQCDDGNDVDDDGCTNACTLPACGDGVLQDGEACDDGNTEDDDGCASDCSTESTCGDGYVNVGEACDDGNDVNADGCSNACVVAACGDGIVQEGEGCDDGNTEDDDACAGDCSTESTCGDGYVNVGEACDDGNDVNTDGCSNACVVAACGDGIVQEGEGCDDGNTEDDDGCASDCSAESTCGDGYVNVGEACDDGNDVNTDGCSNACVVAACGDGIVQDGEACDDGNTVDGDGCSNECVVETSASGTINVFNEWQTGYCANVEITNDAAVATSSWSAVIDLGVGTTYTAWSGYFSGNSGEITVTPFSWNSVIGASGSNASVGFCVNHPAGSSPATVVSVDALY